MTRTDDMTYRLGLRLAAAILPAATLVPALAAHAERVVTEDVVGDAEAYTFEQEPGFVPAPQEETADIIRTVAALGHRRLSVTVHFRDLQVRPRQSTAVRVRTPRGTFDVSAERTSASRPAVTLAPRGGRAVRCSGLRVDYDGAADRVTLSVPAACLGAPRWVRLGVGAIASPVADPDNPSSYVLFADDGHRDIVRINSVGFGPRIHRG